MPSEQTFANHVRFDPPFHFVAFPIVMANSIVMLVRLVRFPSWTAAWQLAVAFAILLIAFRVRTYAIQLQDRIIRIEERVRLQAVLQEPLRSRIGELTGTQFVGLRFASDAELPALVQRALNEKLSRGEIKKAIVNWRADCSRV